MMLLSFSSPKRRHPLGLPVMMALSLANAYRLDLALFATSALLLASLGARPLAAQSAEARPGNEYPIEGLDVQAGGLTADETARRAVTSASSVREKRAQLAAAKARIAQTTVEFFPKLSLRASYTRLSAVESSLGNGALAFAQNAGLLGTGPCPDGSGSCVLDSAGGPVSAAAFDIRFPQNNYALGASLSVPLSDYALRLADAAAAASSSRQAAQYALEAEQRKVRTEARVLYYQWLRAQAEVFIAQGAVQRVSARLEDARVALSVGRLSNAEVLRFEAQQANAQLALQQASALRTLTEAQLAIVMEDRRGGPYRAGQGVPAGSVSAGSIDRGAGQHMVAEALQRRVELKAVAATTRSLDHGQDALRAGAWPHIEAVAEAAYANPNPRYFPPLQKWQATWSLGISASFDVQDPFLSSARASEAAASAEAARSQQRALEAAITNEVITTLLEVIKAQAAITASETALRSAEENYRVRSELFRVGRASPSDIIDSETDLLGAKLQITNARIGSVIAALQLDHALGRDDGSATAPGHASH